MKTALLAALLLPVAGVSIGNPVEKLAWLDTADYRDEFARQVKQDKFTFLGVSGLGYFIPGISSDEINMCFAGLANTKNIDGTSDALESEEHDRLNDLARDYALRLNLLVRAHLVVSGRSPCEPGENWNDLTSIALKYLDRFPESGYAGALLSPEGWVIGLYLPRKQEEIVIEICALLDRLGIRRTIALALAPSDNLRGWVESGKFKTLRCQSGRLTG